MKVLLLSIFCSFIFHKTYGEKEFHYVKVFDTTSRAIEEGYQEDFPEASKTSHICTKYHVPPYVIVYTVTAPQNSTTIYKLCCGVGETGESLCRGFSFDPLDRVGKRNRTMTPVYHQITASNISNNLLMVIVLSLAMYPIWYVLVARPKELKAWTMPPDELEYALFMMADKVRMIQLKFSKEYYMVSGEHLFLDFCRAMASRELHQQKVIEREIRRIEMQKRKQREADYKRFHTGTGTKSDDYPYPHKNYPHPHRKQTAKVPDEKDKKKNKEKIMEQAWQYLRDRLKETKYCELRDVFYVTEMKAVGMGHTPFETVMKSNVQQDSMFAHLYSHGPYCYNWNIRTLIETFDEARELFAKDSVCLQIAGPVAVLGDIRGRYIDLHRWISIIGLPYRKRILFLGNIIETDCLEYNYTSIECLAFVASLKIAYPKHVFMLRGASECVFSFPPKYGTETDLAVLTAARQMCNCLPLAAQIGEDILAVPSGIHHNMTHDSSWQDSLKRPMKPDDLPDVAKYLIFGQPTATTRIYEKTDKGLFIYGLQAILDFCEKTETRRVIRGRSHLMENPLFLADSKLLSLNSIPKQYVPGAALYIDDRVGTLVFKLHWQEESKIEMPKPYNEIDFKTREYVVKPVDLGNEEDEKGKSTPRGSGSSDKTKDSDNTKDSERPKKTPVDKKSKEAEKTKNSKKLTRSQDLKTLRDSDKTRMSETPKVTPVAKTSKEAEKTRASEKQKRTPVDKRSKEAEKTKKSEKTAEPEKPKKSNESDRTGKSELPQKSLEPVKSKKSINTSLNIVEEM